MLQQETLQPEGNSVWEAGGDGSSEGRVVIHSQQADLLLGLPTALAAAAEVSRQNNAAQSTTCAAQLLQCQATALSTIAEFNM